MITHELCTIVVLAEANADMAIATELLDRSIEDSRASWRNERKYCGTTERESFVRFSAVPQLYKAWAGQRKKSFSRHRFTLGDGAIVEKFVRLVSDRRASALLIVRDDDNTGTRVTEIQAGLTAAACNVPTVVGVACPNREAWVLSGFEPEKHEIERLSELKRTLTFCPTLESHRLNDKHGTRSSKMVLSTLSDGDFDREQRCWQETNLAVLKERGHKNGLKDFLLAAAELPETLGL